MKSPNATPNQEQQDSKLRDLIRSRPMARAAIAAALLGGGSGVAMAAKSGNESRPDTGPTPITQTAEPEKTTKTTEAPKEDQKPAEPASEPKTNSASEQSGAPFEAPATQESGVSGNDSQPEAEDNRTGWTGGEVEGMTRPKDFKNDGDTTGYGEGAETVDDNIPGRSDGDIIIPEGYGQDGQPLPPAE